jgi:hypothetical protein
MKVEEELKYLRDKALKLSASKSLGVVHAYGLAERAVAYSKALWVLTGEDKEYAILERAWKIARALRAKAEGME